MHKNIRELIGYTIDTIDGQETGRVQELYFDDISWSIRYLLARTAGDGASRQVIVAREAFMEPDWSKKLFLLNIRKEALLQQPDISTYNPLPLSFPNERAAFLKRNAAATGTEEIATPQDMNDSDLGVAVLKDEIATQQILGVADVSGYSVLGDDGRIGTLSDFVFDDVSWGILYLVVDIGQRLPGARILVAPDLVTGFVHERSELGVNILMGSIRPNASYDRLNYDVVGPREQRSTLKMQSGLKVKWRH